MLPLACVLYYTGPLFRILGCNDLLCCPAKEGSIKYFYWNWNEVLHVWMLLLNDKDGKEVRKIAKKFQDLDLLTLNIYTSEVYLWSEDKGKTVQLGQTDLGLNNIAFKIDDALKLVSPFSLQCTKNVHAKKYMQTSYKRIVIQYKASTSFSHYCAV